MVSGWGLVLGILGEKASKPWEGEIRRSEHPEEGDHKGSPLPWTNGPGKGRKKMGRVGWVMLGCNNVH